VDLPRTFTHKPFEYNAERMANDTPRCDQQGPEIERVASLEDDERFEVYQGGHVYGNRQHCDQD